MRDNALAQPVTQIRRRDRVDVVLTNPPFGGEEEKSDPVELPRGNADGRDRLAVPAARERILKAGGRCGIVVPNGVLFGDGVGELTAGTPARAARIAAS